MLRRILASLRVSFKMISFTYSYTITEKQKYFDTEGNVRIGTAAISRSSTESGRPTATPSSH